MGQSVDTKIVELKFNNDNFKDKVDSTLTQLEQLNKDIKNVGVGDAFKNLGKNIKQVDVSGISDGVQEATKHFSKLEIMGTTALVNLTNSAVNFGKKMVANIVNPLVKGGLTRAQNIKQAKFLFEGMNVFSESGGSSYKEVMDAVTDTAYGYDEAAKAAAQLAASNVGVKKSMKTLADGTKIEAKTLTKDMTTALQAIAGVASMTGSDFDSIAQIFTRVAGQGRVMAMDLNSIASRGLNAAAVLGASLGKTEAEIRDMVSKGKISFAEFSQAMSDAYGAHAKDANMQFTGALSNMQAALKRIGEKVWDPLLDGGRDVINSITPVINLIADKLSGGLEKTDNIIRTSSKRLSQYIDLLDMLIGVPMKGEDEWIKSHMNAWTNLADLFKMGDAYQAAEGLKAYTKSLKEFSGKEGIDGFQMVADYLGKEVKDVKKELKDGTIGFNTFYQSFKKLWTSSDELMSIKDVSLLFDTYVQSCILASGKTEEFTKAYDTLSAVFKGGKDILTDVETIIKSFARIFLSLFDHLRPFGPIIKDVFKELAQASVKIADFVANSKTFNTFIEKSIELLAKFFELLHVETWAPAILTGIGNAFMFIASVVQKIDEGLAIVANAITTTFGDLLERIKATLSSAEEVSKIIQSFKMAGIVVLAVRMVNALMKPADILDTISKSLKDTSKSFKSIFDHIGDVFKSIADMFGKIGKVLDEVRIALVKWQQFLMAGTLLEIGLAIAVVAGALYLLSKLQAEKIENNLLAIFAIGGIIASMYLMLKELKSVDVARKLWEKASDGIREIGAAMLEFAIAIAIMAGALIKLSKLDQNSLFRSFAVVEGLLITLAIIAKMLSGKDTRTTGIKALWSGKKTTTNMTKGVGGLIAMAFAVRILAGAIASIAKITDETALWKAAAIIEGLMITMAGITKWLGKEDPGKMTKGILSLIGMAFAVRLLAKPIRELAIEFSMDPEAVKAACLALWVFLVSMTVVAGVLSDKQLKTGKAIKGAISMVIMAEALKTLAEGVLPLLSYPWESYAIGIGAMIVALYAMVGALAIMSQLDRSGAGLALCGASILLIANALKVLGEVSVLVGKHIDEAGKGLYVMGGALVGLLLLAEWCARIKLTAIGKLALVIIEVIAAVAGFGIAIGILGLGLSVFGASLKTLSDGVKTLYEVGDALFLLAVGLGALALGIVAVPEVLLALGGLAIVLYIIAEAINKACQGFDTLAAAFTVMASLSDQYETLANSVKTFVAAIMDTKSDMQAISALYENFADQLEKVAKTYETLDTTVSSINDKLSNIFSTVSDSMVGLSDAVTALSRIKDTDLDSAATAVKSFVDSLVSIKSNSTLVADSVLIVRDKIELMMTAIDGITQTMKDFGTESEAAFKKVSTSVHSVTDPIITLTEVKDKIKEVEKEVTNFINSIADLKDRAPEVAEATGAMKKAVEDIKDPLAVLAKELDGFHWSVGDVLEHIGHGAKDIAEGFSTLISIKDDLPKTGSAIKKALQKIYDGTTSIEDLADKTDVIAKAIKKLGDNAKAALKNLDTSKFVDSGGKMAKAVAKGIRENKSVEKAIDSTIDKLKTRYNTFYRLGGYLVQGMIRGIEYQLPNLRKVVDELVAEAERAAKAKAEINSPSKVWMRIGMSLGEGLTLGIHKSGDMVAAESANLASTSESAVKAAITSISNAIDSDLNIDPVITPVVDLSNVDASARLLSSRFGSVGVGSRLASSIGGSVQNGSLATNATMSKLNKTLMAMTESMNSRSLNNYITIDGSSDPSAFADDLIRSFRLNARTV